MKKLLLIFAFYSCLDTSAQELFGTYNNESESFCFREDSTVSFKMKESLQDFGWLIQGYGRFRVIDNLLVIQSESYPDTTRVFEVDDGLGKIKVVDVSGQTLPFVTCSFFHKDSLVSVKSTDLDGILKIDSVSIDSVSILNMYEDQKKRFPIQAGYSYIVEFRDYSVIEKKTVIFRIEAFNGCILKIRFLDYDHYLPTYNLERLKKIAKKARWNKTDIRYLEKAN